jgi:enoyl-CoA hydratase/carnithine racemase
VLYSGEVMDAPALLELGLVNRVVPDESLMEETLAYARTIAAGPPLGYAYTRRNVVRSLDNDLRRHQEMEWIYQSDLLKTEDGREGFAAFRERRPPKFVGR